MKTKIKKTDERSKVHQRYYVDDVLVPGVTTVLGILNKPALVVWANRMGLQGIDTTKHVKTAADIGTICHRMIEDDIKSMLGIEHEKLDEKLYAPADIDKAENGMIRWLDFKMNNRFEPIESELQISSRKHGFGGTCDIYCRLNGKLTLLDIKTSSGIYDEMRHQVAAYKQLLVESGREVEQVAVLRVGKEDVGDLEISYIDQQKLDIHFGIFLSCLNIYQLNKKIRGRKNGK